MTSTRRSSWRQALVVASSVEALAVAIWLLPASVHIVEWPLEGPVRLALLAPRWQLLALGVGALVVTGLAAAWSLTRHQPGIGGSERWSLFARAVAPFSLLWLWVVPYLPWLPDKAPLLLVLSGPIRWAIASAAVVIVLLQDTRLQERLRAVLGLTRAWVFGLSLALYLVFGLYAVRTNGLGGDEPHYLIITESLLRDADLKIENNHQRGDYRSFFPSALRPDFLRRGQNGEIYSIHAPGLPLLLLPAYAVAGYLGAVALLCLIAALTALAIFDLASAVAGSRAAVVTWAAVCLTVPFVPHGWLIFPEMPGALLVAWAALWVWRSGEPSTAAWARRGLALAALPWLHTKFVVFLGIFAAALVLRIWRRPRAVLAFLAPIGISGALWMYSFYAIYGVFDPEAPYGTYTTINVLTRNIPHGLVGIFFDQKFGLLFYSPIYLTAIVGAWLLVRQAESRFIGAVLLLVTAAYVGSTTRLYMFWGGASAPARFLVPILPCLAPMVALAVATARGPAARAVIGVWLTIGLAFAAIGVGWPDRLMLFSDPHGRARFLEAIQAGSPLSLVVPTFTDPDWASQIGGLASWLVAVGLGLVAMAVAARLRSPSTWRLAGVGCLTFLAVGAGLTARPGAAVRDETARRGRIDVLWRYDANRLTVFDYSTFAAANADRLLAISTIVAQSESPSAAAGFTARPLDLPSGIYDAVIWFNDVPPRGGEVLVAAPPQVIFGRTAADPLQNPTTVRFELPVAVRRLTVRAPDATIARAIREVRIVASAVVPPRDRENVPVRAIEALPGREHAYLVYTDDSAYPEGGVFWSLGTTETNVLVAPGGASRMRLILSIGAMKGDVTVAIDGKAQRLAMVAEREKELVFDLPPGQRLVPLSIRSTAMFRPADVDKTSTDVRSLGCHVQIALE